MADIIYTGEFDDLDELKSLYDKDGKLNDDKLLQWLSTSNHIECDESISKEIRQQLRKRKIDKLNNNDI